jgi:hypothetical protein
MNHYFTWDDNSIIWNNNPYIWNAVYEVILTPSTAKGGAAFYKDREKDKKYKEDKKYIKILCIINDEKFEESKYVNKKLKIQSSDEEFVIREIKKVDVSEDGIKFNISEDVNNFVLKNNDKKVMVTVNNIKKNNTTYVTS